MSDTIIEPRFISTRLKALSSGMWSVAFRLWLVGTLVSGCIYSGFEVGADAGTHKNAGNREDPTLAALKDWPYPPQESETTVSVGGQPVTNEEGVVFGICDEQSQSVLKNYSEILALGTTYGDEFLDTPLDYSQVTPGLVLQGKLIEQGTMTAVPLPRSPLRISIDLAIKNPTRIVDNPTEATIQAAISNLQLEADTTLGNLPNLQKKLTFAAIDVQSWQEAAVRVGVPTAYAIRSFPMIALAAEEFAARPVIAAKLFQPMFTVRFLDDAYPTARSFFASSVTASDFTKQYTLGNISNDNLPVYVESVTYGRMIVFTIRAPDGVTVDDLLNSVYAPYYGISLGSSVEARLRSILASSSISRFAAGGSPQLAFDAITSGDYSMFFGSAKASDAVPLVYRMKSLTGLRRPVFVSDDIQYSRFGPCQSVPVSDGCRGVTLNLSPLLFCGGKRTYADAIVQCQSLGMQLLKINDEVEYQIMLEMLGALSVPPYMLLRASRTASGWSWQQDTYDPVTYLPWAPDQPDSSDENCLGVDPATGWHDIDCSAPQPYGCSE